MPFDIEKMLAYCRVRVEEFARRHKDETFYAFTIDADLLCVNSIERFAESLHQYQSSWDHAARRIGSMAELTDEDRRQEEYGLKLEAKYCGLDRSDDQACLAFINKVRDERRSKGDKYRTEDGIQELKENTGDWIYQGFANFHDEFGFDHELYQEHYDEAAGAEGHAPHTEYAQAMTALVARLRESDVFEPLKRTKDFYVNWVDHSY